MRIILASHNPGKLAELQSLLADLPVRLESQADHQIPAAAETGSTFIENALLKARAVASATGSAALADDSGLVVPALNGAPGIHSARYAGTHGDDAANNQKLIKALQAQSDRSAYFYCAMVLLRHATDPTPMVATAAWHGEICTEAAGEFGFGYDPHFFLPELQKTSAQLEPHVKNALSHRGQALRTLLGHMQQADWG